MIGKLLEISVASDDLLKHIGWWEEHGFHSLEVNEIWSHQYGVMSNGSLNVGLHNTELTSPTLTFVLPELASHIPDLSKAGINFELMQLSDEHFHQAGFTDASGVGARWLEARTFSPSIELTASSHVFGELDHAAIPAVNGNQALWQELQFSSDRVMATEQATHLTVIMEADVETLIVEAAKNGWTDFSVTADNQGLLRTPHGFDLLVRSPQP